MWKLWAFYENSVNDRIYIFFKVDMKYDYRGKLSSISYAMNVKYQ